MALGPPSQKEDTLGLEPGLLPHIPVLFSTNYSLFSALMSVFLFFFYLFEKLYSKYNKFTMLSLFQVYSKVIQVSYIYIIHIYIHISYTYIIHTCIYAYIIYIHHTYIYAYIYILFQILFHYSLLQDIESSSLCFTVGFCLPILYTVVCI